MRGGLHEFNLVAFGVGYCEPLASVAAAFHLVWRCDAVRAHVTAQAVGIGGDESDVVKAVDGVLGGQGQHFNKLHGAEVIANAVRILRFAALYAAQVVHVKLFGLGAVGSVDGDVRNSRDERAGILSLRARESRD